MCGFSLKKKKVIWQNWANCFLVAIARAGAAVRPSPVQGCWALCSFFMGPHT